MRQHRARKFCHIWWCRRSGRRQHTFRIHIIFVAVLDEPNSKIKVPATTTTVTQPTETKKTNGYQTIITTTNTTDERVKIDENGTDKTINERASSDINDTSCEPATTDESNEATNPKLHGPPEIKDQNQAGQNHKTYR